MFYGMLIIDLPGGIAFAKAIYKWTP